MSNQIDRISSTLLHLVVALAALPAIACAQSAPPHSLAPFPKALIESEREVLTQSALMLVKGQFDLAAALLKPLTVPAVVRVYVDWAPVPETSRADYRKATQAALHAWNLGLANVPQFQITDHEQLSDLTVLFEQQVPQAKLRLVHPACIATDSEEAVASKAVGRRVGKVWISLYMPNAEAMHSPASISHLVGQALGSYLGLSPSAESADIMGPDTHANTVSEVPSARDIENARLVLRARQQLAALAQKRTAVSLPRAILTVENENIDSGDVMRGDMAHFEFKLKNTGDVPLEIFARPNCGCTALRFDKVIQPGCDGKIHADVNTLRFHGRVQKVIEVESNDIVRPHISLHLLANVLSAVQVLPSESIVIPIRSDSTTVKEMEIRTSGKDAVEITSATCSAPYARVTLGHAIRADGLGYSYKLSLTVASNAPIGRSVFTVTANTTSSREPTVTITATCENGIVANPRGVFFGSVTPTTTLPITQIVTLSSSNGLFQVRRVETDDPKLSVVSAVMEDGTQYRLTVTYKGGWPAGLAEGKIRVETDDPRQHTIEIPVVANLAGVNNTAK